MSDDNSQPVKDSRTYTQAEVIELLGWMWAARNEWFDDGEEAAWEILARFTQREKRKPDLTQRADTARETSPNDASGQVAEDAVRYQNGNDEFEAALTEIEIRLYRAGVLDGELIDRLRNLFADLQTEVIALRNCLKAVEAERDELLVQLARLGAMEVLERLDAELESLRAARFPKKDPDYGEEY